MKYLFIAHHTDDAPFYVIQEGPCAEEALIAAWDALIAEARRNWRGSDPDPDLHEIHLDLAFELHGTVKHLPEA